MFTLYKFESATKNSKIINCPSIINNYIDTYKQKILSEAEKENKDIEEYANSKSGLSLDDMIEYRKNYYEI